MYKSYISNLFMRNKDMQRRYWGRVSLEMPPSGSSPQHQVCKNSQSISSAHGAGRHCSRTHVTLFLVLFGTFSLYAVICVKVGHTAEDDCFVQEISCSNQIILEGNPRWGIRPSVSDPYHWEGKYCLPPLEGTWESPSPCSSPF